MSFPARGNLRLVAIGGSKLAREAVSVLVLCAKEGQKEREREREDARGESAQQSTKKRRARRGGDAGGRTDDRSV